MLVILVPDVIASSLRFLSRVEQSPQSLRKCRCMERCTKWEKAGDRLTWREMVAVISNWPKEKVLWNFLKRFMIRISVNKWLNSRRQSSCKKRSTAMRPKCGWGRWQGGSR